MLRRYRTTADGEHAVTARVYMRAEHGIDREQFDRDALAVVGRLQRAGHEAYFVGGAIRDLVTGRTPKDFDIATSARPRVVTRLFSRARIIGRRFKLVHVPAGRQGIVEVSTFRGPGSGGPGAGGPGAGGPGADGDNHYGTMAEDALRRDFTVNGLYYCPRRQQIIDYVGGFRDLTAGRLRTIGDPEQAFVDDPVRMLRAIKYAAFLEVRLPEQYRRLIRRHAGLLGECPTGRLSEELRKLLASGNGSAIVLDCARLGLLSAMLPAVAGCVRPRRQDPLIVELARIERTAPAGEETRQRAMAALAVTVNGIGAEPTLSGVKEAFAPLAITNEDARSIVASLGGGQIEPKSRPRRRRRTRSRTAPGR